ncbi:hypothetical protein F7Q99_36190 [Streptomyces kaniharaensis]|uniref:Uncharacterized protein n=1 Tax=Streptomyces kaniharaensis TaxID=212423 RepID=A0A6N7L5Y1_9ACTN|nr:hypothetical protein [Streptomyces kaniharaensis]MQS17483.1 hypothetical protein [Streptomyces kaniharaensis]
MGVLKLDTGEIVGYRVNGKVYPITMANAQRAIAVMNCIRKYGGPTESNFTAYELEKFCEESGLPLFERHTRWIIRGIYFYAVTQRADAVANAETVSLQDAPRPTVKRPAGKAYDALMSAKTAYEGTRSIAEDAHLAARRGRGSLERAGRAIGAERAEEVMEGLLEYVRLAVEAAEAAKARFIDACNRLDETYAAAGRLKIHDESRLADRTMSLAMEVEDRALAARDALYAAQAAEQKLRGAAERWAAYQLRKLRAGQPARGAESA